MRNTESFQPTFVFLYYSLCCPPDQPCPHRSLPNRGLLTVATAAKAMPNCAQSPPMDGREFVLVFDHGCLLAGILIQHLGVLQTVPRHRAQALILCLSAKTKIIPVTFVALESHLHHCCSMEILMNSNQEV